MKSKLIRPLLVMAVSTTFLTNHSNKVFANELTLSEVALHNTTDDCYMIFENKVYDFTKYLQEHSDLYLDIGSWCGEDMTEDFVTKDDRGRDHRPVSYAMLVDYVMGDLVSEEVTTTPENEETVTTEEPTTSTIEEPVEETDVEPESERKVSSPYNFPIPFFLSAALYLIHWRMVESKKFKSKLFNKLTFNFVWNTVLIITTVPAILFGFLLAIRYSMSTIRMPQFNILWWHVEGGIAFGTVTLLHLLTRLNQYLHQAKFSLKKMENKDETC